MTIEKLMELLEGLLKFPTEVTALITLLQNTPQENHEGIMERISKEEHDFEETGVPKW